MMNKGFYEDTDEAYFIDVVEKNITSSRFLLMIVGDGIREDVSKMTEFLNTSVSMQFQLALCELEVYKLDNGNRLVVPQLTTKTKVITRTLINTVDKVEIQNETPVEKAKTNPTRKTKPISLEEWADTVIDKKTEILEIFEQYKLNF